MQNEFQNAFAAAHIEYGQAGKIGRDPRIDETVKAGEFAVVEDYVVYCPYTDATLGTRENLVATADTRGAAQAAAADYLDDLGGDCGGEIRVHVEPSEPEPEYNPEDDACREADNDVPF